MTGHGPKHRVARVRAHTIKPGFAFLKWSLLPNRLPHGGVLSRREIVLDGISELWYSRRGVQNLRRSNCGVQNSAPLIPRPVDAVERTATRHGGTPPHGAVGSEEEGTIRDGQVRIRSLHDGE